MSKIYDRLNIPEISVIIFIIVLVLGYFIDFWNFTKVYGYLISLLIVVSFDLIKSALDKKNNRAIISIKSLNLIQGIPPDSQAQFINLVRTNFHETVNLTARFGVLKVKVIKGEVLNCTAEINYKPSFFNPNGDKIDLRFRNGGRLNWYSVSKFDNIGRVPDFQPYKLNNYLCNPIIDLHDGEEKELLVCYVIDSISTNVVNLCTESESTGVAQFDKGGKANFQVEICIVGNGYPKKSWYFDITVNKTSIILNPINGYK